MRHYPSAVDYIKNRKFPVEVPAYYHPHLPKEMVEPEKHVVPPFNRYGIRRLSPKPVIPHMPIQDPNQLQTASYSIETMLDMFHKKVEFTLLQTYDIVEILDNIDRYLVSLQRDVESGETRIVEYAKLVIAFRGSVYKHYFRYMKQNPAALEKLYPNEDPSKNFISLLGGITGDTQIQNMDPLKAKAFPPYTIQDPKTEDRHLNAGSAMARDFGISKANQILNDDGKNFDFNDFLNKG